jgi:hypothetical protein
MRATCHIQHQLHHGPGVGLQFADDQPVVPGGLPPVNPPGRVPPTIRPHPQHVPVAADFVPRDAALGEPLPARGRDRPDRPPSAARPAAALRHGARGSIRGCRRGSRWSATPAHRGRRPDTPAQTTNCNGCCVAEVRRAIPATGGTDGGSPRVSMGRVAGSGKGTGPNPWRTANPQADHGQRLRTCRLTVTGSPSITRARSNASVPLSPRSVSHGQANPSRITTSKPPANAKTLGMQKQTAQ